MPKITIEIDSPKPVAEAFAFVTDYRNTPSWYYGMTSYEPVGAQTTGVGATYEAVLNLGAKIKSTVQVTKLVEDEVYVVASTKGVSNTSTYTFSPTPDGGTHLVYDLDYDFGSSLAGKTLAKLVGPVVGVAVRAITQGLTEKLG